MTARAAITYQPRLLGEAEAASYLGISATTLRGLGIPRRTLGARRLFDRLDLDAFAGGLPYEGDSRTDEDASEWDKAFGIDR